MGQADLEKVHFKKSLGGLPKYFEKSLALYQEHNYPNNIAMSLNNLSYFHVSQGNYEKALEYGLACLKTSREQNNHHLEITVYLGPPSE